MNVPSHSIRAISRPPPEMTWNFSHTTDVKKPVDKINGSWALVARGMPTLGVLFSKHDTSQKNQKVRGIQPLMQAA